MNIVTPLRKRQHLSHHTSAYRHDLNILRRLVLSDNITYKKCFKLQSKSAIIYDNGRIYLDNYTHCLSVSCGQLKLQYSLNSDSKIEDCLLLQAPVSDINSDCACKKCCVTSLLVLSSKSRHVRRGSGGCKLQRLDVASGRVLQSFELQLPFAGTTEPTASPPFRSVGWNVMQESLYVKTTLSRGSSTLNADVNLCSFAVFQVFPMVLTCFLDVGQRVFGQAVVDAQVNQDTVILMFAHGLVRIYYLQRLLQGTTEASTSTSPAAANPHLSFEDEQPQVIFEINCWDHDIQIGGYPWHFIMKPISAECRDFHIVSIDGRRLTGVISTSKIALETEKVYFHDDDSGRILHVGAHMLCMYSISCVEPSKESANGLGAARQCHLVEPSKESATGLGGARQRLLMEPSKGRVTTVEPAREHRHVAAAGKWDSFRNQTTQEGSGSTGAGLTSTITSSGRRVKQRCIQGQADSETPSVMCVEYEDELDMIYVTHSDGHGCIHLSLLANDSLDMLKTLPLGLDVQDDDELMRGVGTTMDLDVIVHMTKQASKFVAYLYQLCRVARGDDEMLEPPPSAARHRTAVAVNAELRAASGGRHQTSCCHSIDTS